MTAIDQHRHRFSVSIPELIRIAAAAFRHLAPEAREEAIQNSLALTWKAYHALVEQGRADELNILKSCLWYSIRQTRAGRQPQGSGATKAKDVFGGAHRGRVRFERIELDNFVADDTPVPEQVSFRIDVPAFFATLSDRQRSIAEDLMLGMATGEAARKYRVTPGAISQFRQRFKDMFDAFMSE